MALDTASIPCNLLNNATSPIPAPFSGTTFSFEDVWIPAGTSVSTALQLIIITGTLKKFSDILTTTRLPATNTGKMIGTPDTSSKFRLISFLSDGGVSMPVVTGQSGVAPAATAAAALTAALAAAKTAADTVTAAGASVTAAQTKAKTDADVAVVTARAAVAGRQIDENNSNLCKILYTNNSKYLSIVDDLFVGNASITALTVSSVAGINFSGLGKGGYTFSGDTGGTGFTGITDNELTTLVDNLQKAKYLLKDTDLYPANAANPGSNSTALISLFQLVAQGETLTNDQKTSLYELQTRNLRFFAAFLAEYCFYRTRYDWFLVQFFKYYTMSATEFSSDTNKTSFYSSLNITNAVEKTQPKLLQGIATQMATLNTRMVDMKRLLNAINQSYQTIFKSVQERINSGGPTILGSNQNVVAATQALSSSAESAEKYLSDAEFRKGIMDYTSEKNRYSNILLGFYAFLNIAALAAIFQLARS
jgi:hypothetical protein